MRLYLCEKPSLGREVAKALGGGKTGDGLIEGNGWVVSWLFGHMYELASPENYFSEWKHWKLDTLPMLPTDWQRQPRKGVSKQLTVIRRCLKQACEVVNAGDTGREGELLIRELLEEMNWRGPLFRLWHHSLELPVLKKALANLRPGSDFDPLLAAAKARQFSDWLVGMNFSRAYTVMARKTAPSTGSGKGSLVSVGRVQSPTLALVVTRDRLIESFTKVEHYSLEAEFLIKGVRYWGQWQAPEALLDEQGHLLDVRLTEAPRAAIVGQSAILKQSDSPVKRTPPPLPFSLSKLQALASKRFGFSAKSTLDALQSLYEKHKLLTYPRTDCEYLSSAQLADVPRQMQAISGISDFSEHWSMVNASLKPRAYNDSKVGEHTAIVPTGVRPSLEKLSNMELTLYLACAARWLMQFCPALEVRRWELVTEVAGHSFLSKGRQVEQMGWRALEKPALSDDWIPGWQQLQAGDQGSCTQAEVRSHETEPPDYYTDGTLIAAMTQIAKQVDDPELRERLKEAKGIGEESSRASIIELLIDRGYLYRQGKQLRSSDFGRQIVDWLLPALTSPILTARWERGLSMVEEGALPLDEFLQHQGRWISRLISQIQQQPVPVLSQSTKPAYGAKGKKASWRKGASRKKAGSDVAGASEPSKPRSPRRTGKASSDENSAPRRRRSSRATAGAYEVSG
ncbi:DNA topoisomerase 3 [Pokkaliibacter sp. CJK22405]|uniref:DNA topoisomerase 3 n=1 Tax=Pokkaliibacter sp. CJK22405 TaxID=3384615 RepID=UPI0039852BAF